MRCGHAAGLLAMVAGCYLPTDRYRCEEDADCAVIAGASCVSNECRVTTTAESASSSSGSAGSSTSSGTGSTSSGGISGGASSSGSSGGAGSSSGSSSGGGPCAGNRAPTLSEVILPVTPGSEVMGQVVGMDADGDILTYAAVSNPDQGMLQFATGGAFSFTGDAGMVGTDVFLAVATDDCGASSEPARVELRGPLPFTETIRWVGGDSAGPRDWAVDANWSGMRVPGSSDAVLVPMAANAPRISMATAIRALKVEAGGRVELAAVDLSVEEAVYADGIVDGTGLVNVTGTSARIAGNIVEVQARGNVQVVAAMQLARNLRVSGNPAGTVVVGGSRVQVGGDVVVNYPGGLLVMQHVAGRVEVTGDVSFTGADSRGRLTGGELRVLGDFNAQGDGFRASANHRVVLAGPGGHAVTMTDPAEFNHLRVEGQGGATLVNNARVLGDLVLRGSGPVTSAVGVSLDVAGDCRTDPGTQLDVHTLRLRGAGPETILGELGAQVLRLSGMAQILGPEREYANLVIDGDVETAAGTGATPITVTGGIDVRGQNGIPGTFTVHGRVNVAMDLAINSYGELVMPTAGAVLAVRGATFAGNQGSLVEGTLEVSGALSANGGGLHAEGAHVVRMVGSTSRSLTLANQFPYPQVNHLEVNTPGATLAMPDIVRATGDVRIMAGTADVGDGRALNVGGQLSVATGATLTGDTVVLQHSSMLSGVAGTLTADTLNVAAVGATLPVQPAGVTYNNVVVSAAGVKFAANLAALGMLNVQGTNATVELQGDASFNGNVLVTGSGASINLGGHALTTNGNFRVENQARLRMAAGDVLTVAGGVQLATNSDTTAVTGGEIIALGDFDSDGYSGLPATGSHLVRFAGGATHQVRFTNNGTGNPNGFQDVLVEAGNTVIMAAGPVQVHNDLAVSGTLELPTGVTLQMDGPTGAELLVNAGASLNVQGNLQLLSPVGCVIQPTAMVTGFTCP